MEMRGEVTAVEIQQELVSERRRTERERMGTRRNELETVRLNDASESKTPLSKDKLENPLLGCLNRKTSSGTQSANQRSMKK